MSQDETGPFSRRKFLKSSAAIAAGISAGGLLPAQLLADTHSSLPLITKPIPSTGEQLPVIGIGTNAYSVDSPEDMAPLREVLELMPQLGGTMVDTARVYGRSEEVIGEIVEELGNRDQLFIASKTPIRGEFGDPEEELMVSYERLRMDRLDLMLIHNLHGLDAFMPAYIRFKDQGLLRYIGMSTSSKAQYEQQMAAMRRYPLDFIQVDYSIDNRSAADEMLPLAQEQGVAVMINVPFGGRQQAASTFSRVSGVELPDWAAEIDAHSWAQVFLKYIVSHPAVNVAIPGTTNVRHLRDNQGAARGRLPDADLRREIERFWDGLPA